jgi:hypothetical protein
MAALAHICEVDLDEVEKLFDHIEREVKPQIMPFYACEGPGGDVVVGGRPELIPWLLVLPNCRRHCGACAWVPTRTRYRQVVSTGCEGHTYDRLMTTSNALEERMVYQLRKRGHVYLYQVGYGEEASVARIIVRSDAGGTEGLFLVKQDGSLENADDRPGFGANGLSHDGLWPTPPREAIRDARAIAQQKAHTAMA